MQEVLSNALAMHQAGQLSSAAQLYNDVLAAEPDDADAQHLLGVLHDQHGDHAAGVELIGEAAALRLSVPAFHVNLAKVHRALGQFDRAVGCCRIALRLSPNHLEAHGNLGLPLRLVFQQEGQFGDAPASLKQAVETKLEDVIFWKDLAEIVMERRDCWLNA